MPDVQNPGHYRKFEDIYSTETTEEHRPSLKQGKGKLSSKEAGYRISGETVRQVVFCEECKKPRYV